MPKAGARFTCIASQGGAGLMPQNTLAAIENASRLRAHGSEIDIHLTSDLVMVLHHDHALNKDIARMPDGKWLMQTGPVIAETKYADLCTYDIGATRPGSTITEHYPEQQPCDDGQRIPTLNEVFELYDQLGDRHSELWIEPKPDPFEKQTSVASPEAFAKFIVQACENYNFVTRAVVICFDWRLLVSIKAQNPNIRTGFLTVEPEVLMAVPAFAEEGRQIKRALDGLPLGLLSREATKPSVPDAPGKLSQNSAVLIGHLTMEV